MSNSVIVFVTHRQTSDTGEHIPSSSFVEAIETGVTENFKTPTEFVNYLQDLYKKQNTELSQFRIDNVVIG